jgi:hypothetical protein
VFVDYGKFLGRQASAEEARGWLGLYQRAGQDAVAAAILGVPGGEFANGVG